MAIPGIRPVLITGVYRSGTTLMSRILNNHPDLSITYDSIHYLRFSIHDHPDVSRPGAIRALLADVAARVARRWKRPVDLAPVVAALERMPAVDHATVYDALMKHLLIERNGQDWGEKSMLVWTLVPLFLEMFPDGRVVHVVRDPRDVTASYRAVTWEKGLRYLDAAFATLHSMRHALRYRDELAGRSYALVRYEDLVTNPESTVGALCTRIGLPYDAAMLDTELFRDRSGVPWPGNSAYEERRATISPGSVGAHQSQLDAVERYFVEMVAGDAMHALGYELAAEPLNAAEWQALHKIIHDPFIAGRFKGWLGDRMGVEEYPTPPPRT